MDNKTIRKINFELSKIVYELQEKKANGFNREDAKLFMIDEIIDVIDFLEEKISKEEIEQEKLKCYELKVEQKVKILSTYIVEAKNPTDAWMLYDEGKAELEEEEVIEVSDAYYWSVEEV